MIHKASLRKVFTLFKESVFDFLDDNAMKFSAALSYYTIFALPPMIMVILWVSSIFIEQQQVADFLYAQLSELVGENSSLELQKAIGSIALNRSGSISTWIGLGMLLFSASGVFAEIQSSINYIWGLASKPDKSAVFFIKNRLLSFAMIGSVGFILLVSLFLNSIISILSNYLAQVFSSQMITLAVWVNSLVVFFVITILFAIIFKTLPNGSIGTKETLVGSGFTAVLFMIGKYVIGLYLSGTATSSLYGAAGSIIVILIWVYYSAIILYFGAEFTKNYARFYGKAIVPGPYAIAINKSALKKTASDSHKMNSTKS